MILRARGDHAGAVAANEEAVRAQPTMSPEILADLELELGRSRFAAGDVEGALAIGERALGRLESLPPSNLARFRGEAFVGRAEARLGRSDAARARLARIDGSGAKLAPLAWDLDARLERAELLHELGLREAARAEWNAIVESEELREMRLAVSRARSRLAGS